MNPQICCEFGEDKLHLGACLVVEIVFSFKVQLVRKSVSSHEPCSETAENDGPAT